MRPVAPPVETSELARALAPLLGPGLGNARKRFALLDRRPLEYHSTFPLEELVVRLADGTELPLVFKDMSRPGSADPAWRVKAPFLHDPLREIDTYREVLAPNEISAPQCLGVVVDARCGRYWLFLEKIDGVALWQIGDMGIWRRVAEWLAALHARFAGRTGTLPARLLACDAGYYCRWLDRARAFVRWPETSAADARGFEWLERRYLGAVDWVVEQPTTFLHGEFYPSNILVEQLDAGARVRPVDWEMAAIGPGVLDLAALTSGGWGESDRQALAQSYRAALPDSLRPTPSALDAALERCRLLIAVQWLGWSAGWTPPAQHSHDWLREALDLAERVGP
ncbi:hypothetical protein BH18GEM1_BH18GEM1_07750 [soil metagenome]